MVQRYCHSNLHIKREEFPTLGQVIRYCKYSGIANTNRKLTKNSVKITLRINKTKTAVAKCLTEALKQLETDGKICNEYSCICQQQYPNCPRMEITE